MITTKRKCISKKNAVALTLTENSKEMSGETGPGGGVVRPWSGQAAGPGRTGTEMPAWAWWACAAPQSPGKMLRTCEVERNRITGHKGEKIMFFSEVIHLFLGNEGKMMPQ